jgi:hypothetical protein
MPTICIGNFNSKSYCSVARSALASFRMGCEDRPLSKGEDSFVSREYAGTDGIGASALSVPGLQKRSETERELPKKLPS